MQTYTVLQDGKIQRVIWKNQRAELTASKEMGLWSYTEENGFCQQPEYGLPKW